LALSRAELAFIAAGAGLGALAGVSLALGWRAPSEAVPSYLIVLLGLGVIELLAGYALARSPGTLVRMPARIAAFALGIGVLMLSSGGLA
jgi:hypothetical protein